ncbi:MAG TPA: hypothetical protein DCG19_11640 [Cryomorphaceae bacterium]|nr:hypothetical protein [Owenweeksia sp.]MBG00329.1 hypothetical protein [Owenweeksia sp.]HAD98051.1 hypothetical protein [Cryomorphaceae bacterium]HBF19260.1 hypothetical protein [Cryomorphaceae bacterium]|tara:strand:- start:402 stop:1001 length:600 start_codon:yes stop_codon:yes gene_type:complete
MTLYHKVRAVERVFHQLEKDVATFQQATTLGCLSGCGRCCQKSDINATSLEFLPFAYHLYKTGEALRWHEHLNNDRDNHHCPAFSPFLRPGDKGFCQAYAYRGLICRLFGFSAMMDKYGDPRLVTCRPIKETFPASVEKAHQHIAEGKSTPVMRNYYFQLRSIDPDMGNRLMPINLAILEALKTVLSYYAYPSRYRKKA